MQRKYTLGKTNNINPIPSEAAFLSLLIKTISIAKATKAAYRVDTFADNISAPVSPVMALPLMLLRQQQIETGIPALNDISFPHGVAAGEMRISKFRACLQAYANKEFIPIINFPANNEEDDQKNDILTAIEDVLIEMSGNVKNVSTGIRYIIGECVDNITQHSKSDKGYIHATINREEKFIDICIADRGITLLGSYRENNDEDILSDMEAMKAANRGISTKNLPDAVNRGYGIITTKNMLTQGLGGLFLMISGKAMAIHSGKVHEYAELPDDLYCSGTAVIYRLYYDKTSFNYINYIE
ncbi:MAG: hypothetical protein HUK08_02480 [Bacteroidaceae bacterium]|nr:hypothetical protein [Bacteroidaceae bacterium]